MNRTITTAVSSPLIVDKAAKRSIDTSGHDTSAATVLGIVGALAILLTCFLVWYFRRQTNPENFQSRRVDLLESRQSVLVDVEKALPERHSMASSTTSTVLSTETRAIIVATPTPMMPVQASTRQRVSSVVRPFSTSGDLPPTSRLMIGNNHARASFDAAKKTISTANAQPSFIYRPIVSCLPSAAGPRLKVHNLTKEDISPSVSSSISQTGESNPTPVLEQPNPSDSRSKAAKEQQPSDLIISRQTTFRVKTRITPNVPASPSQNEWSAGPVATPSTSSHMVHIPGILSPRSAELPLRFKPHVRLSRITIASVSNDDVDRMHDGTK